MLGAHRRRGQRRQRRTNIASTRLAARPSSRVRLAMLPATPRSSSSPRAPRTCTLRTRFSSYPDLERAVALSVREDGRLFVPLLPEQVRRGETLKVAFITDDGAAAVNRLAVVE